MSEYKSIRIQFFNGVDGKGFNFDESNRVIEDMTTFQTETTIKFINFMDELSKLAGASGIFEKYNSRITREERVINASKNNG